MEENPLRLALPLELIETSAEAEAEAERAGKPFDTCPVLGQCFVFREVGWDCRWTRRDPRMGKCPDRRNRKNRGRSEENHKKCLSPLPNEGNGRNPLR